MGSFISSAAKAKSIEADDVVADAPRVAEPSPEPGCEDNSPTESISSGAGRWVRAGSQWKKMEEDE